MMPVHTRHASMLLRSVVALVVGVALLGVVGCAKPKVEVPDISYMTSEEASAALEEAKLTLGTTTEEASEDMPIGGYVIGTSPAIGTEVEEGSAVDVVLSKGPKLTDAVEVPDLTGLTAEEAEAKLFDALLIPQPGDQAYSETVEAGKVRAQSVPAGTRVEMLSTITYSVSLGKDEVAVPDVVGKPADEARDVLAKAGLSYDTITSYSDTVASNSVVSQSVAKDSKVARGTTVVLEISLGKKPAAQVLVPNIVSYTLADAKKALESAGLKYTFTGDEKGTVISVKPVPNTKVDQGSTVAFELKIPQPIEDNTKAEEAAKKAEEEKKKAEEEAAKKAEEEARKAEEEAKRAEEEAEEEKRRLWEEQSISPDEGYHVAVDALKAGEEAEATIDNVRISELSMDGDYPCYTVEFDMSEAHYTISVDALTGEATDIVEAKGNVRNHYDGKLTLLASEEV